MHFYTFSLLFFVSTVIGLEQELTIYDVCPPVVLQKINPIYLQARGETCFYFAASKRRTYPAARADCGRHDGTLAMPKTEGLNDFLTDTAYNVYHLTDPTWIGLHDSITETEFLWEDGTNMVWNNFAGGQGRENVLGRFEDCVAIDPLFGVWHDFQCVDDWWSTLSLSQPKKPYICQYEAEFVIPEVVGEDTKGEDEAVPTTVEPEVVDETAKGEDEAVPTTVESEVVGETAKGEDETVEITETQNSTLPQAPGLTKDGCPTFQCLNDCDMRGYKRDEHDCQTCLCNE